MNSTLRKVKSRPDQSGLFRGFTLIELLITIAVAGVLASLALPSFKNFILTQRVKAASFDLVANLALTRSEAVKRNADVSMTATSSAWKNGWKVSAGGVDVRVQEKYVGLSITDSAGLNVVTFRGDGRLVTAATNFTVTTDPASDVTPRCVRISLSGQASSAQGGC